MELVADELTLVAPFNAKLHSLLISEIDLSVLWQGMQWRNEQTEARGQLGKLLVKSQLTENDGLWLMPQANLLLEQPDLRQPDRQLQLTQWHWQTGVAKPRWFAQCG